jgi:hypothetical protein
VTKQEQLFDDGAIWQAAREDGIVLVPFNSNGASSMCAAINNDFLEEAMKAMGLNPDSWDDVYSLGLGFFVDTSAPGSGANRAESYRDALAQYEQLGMKAKSAKQLAELRAKAK